MIQTINKQKSSKTSIINIMSGFLDPVQKDLADEREKCMEVDTILMAHAHIYICG